jgi:glycosyltransferase involved in cell wall biosynthesis
MVEQYSHPEWEGVTLLPVTGGTILEMRQWADVAFTQVHGTVKAIKAFAGHVPLVHFIHVDSTLSSGLVKPGQADLVVYNSDAMAERLPWAGRAMTLPPMIEPSRYRTTRGDSITLINLNENKGARVMFDIARALPYRPFIGVQGSYGRQLRPMRPTPNVTILGHTPKITEVYSQTRILLMPSASETWGRVALEAACSGIPTIAHPTPGVVEALGDSGLFVDRKDVRGWVDTILSLDNAETYRQISDRATARAHEMSPDTLLQRLETELLEINK